MIPELWSLESCEVKVPAVPELWSLEIFLGTVADFALFLLGREYEMRRNSGNNGRSFIRRLLAPSFVRKSYAGKHCSPELSHITTSTYS